MIPSVPSRKKQTPRMKPASDASAGLMSNMDRRVYQSAKDTDASGEQLQQPVTHLHPSPAASQQAAAVQAPDPAPWPAATQPESMENKRSKSDQMREKLSEVALRMSTPPLAAPQPLWRHVMGGPGEAQQETGERLAKGGRGQAHRGQGSGSFRIRTWRLMDAHSACTFCSGSISASCAMASA